MWIAVFIALGLAGLALAGDVSQPSGDPSEVEVLYEPEEAEEATAKYVIELRHFGDDLVQWTVWGIPAKDIEEGRPIPEMPLVRPEIGTGQARSRLEAVDEAEDAIERWRTKLPTSVTRHGLEVGAECTDIKVVNLKTWIDWAAKKIRTAAEAETGPFAEEKTVTGNNVMRWAFGLALPECDGVTPTVRGQPWSKVVKGVQRIIAKQFAGTFIDVHSLEVVLAARLVGMSPPAREGQAFYHEDPTGERYGIVITKTAKGRWRYRIWRGGGSTRMGRPWTKGATDTQADAVSTAKRLVEAQGGAAASG